MDRMLKIGCVALLFALPLAACSKTTTSSSSTTTTTAAPSAVSSAMTPSGGAMNGAQASAGAKVFATNCSSCHQSTGQGIPGTFPPLAGNPVVVGDPTKVIHIVKFGLTGKISAGGHAFNGVMPAWRQQLSNADIASAITYMRSAWGNKASAVSASDVAAVKQ